LAAAAINETVLNDCIVLTDAKYKITENYNNQSTWRSGRYPLFPVFEVDVANYGVTGSPSLFINGEKANVERNSAALLSAICASFKNPPVACSTELSTAVPSPGFGSGTGASAGSCGD
jgi:hypothetical protein